MKDKIRTQIEYGIAPIHLLSLKGTSGERAVITKNRVSKNYHSKHLQIGVLYKSAL